MKLASIILVVVGALFTFSTNGQYYLRGEVRDEKGKLLPDVKIILQSKGSFPFNSGYDGNFGIALNTVTDSITLLYDGYETIHQLVDARNYQVVVMKILNQKLAHIKHKLTSKTKNLATNYSNNISSFGESYSSLIENDFIDASAYPETGFSLNIDRASYSNIRRFLMNEMDVPVDAVRIDEMLNYFDLKIIDTVKTTNKFNYHTLVTTCPWNAQNNLLFVNIIAPTINLDTVPPSNLVFLIDVSGSMDRPNRLPLLQSAFKLLVNNIREKDTISIVTYGGGVQVVLNRISGNEKEKIKNAIDSLYADGDTPGENAIRTAYYIAKKAFIKNGNNRIILATDGDFNIGQTSDKELEDMILFEKQSGIYLTCLGVGMGNYKDSKLETLSKKGNGNFAYLDNIDEAEKVLIAEFAKTMFVVANDAYFNIQFNKNIVKEYRLIGFDNKKQSIADTTNELQGGEIGSGHNMIAVFEIVPAEHIGTNMVMANMNLQYKLPPKNTYCVENFSSSYQPILFTESPASVRFATAIVMLGELLKQSKYSKSFNYDNLLNIANAAINVNNRQQQEFIELIKKAQKVYNYKYKKKKRFN